MNATRKAATRCWAVVPAAGAGARMNASLPKQYLQLAGRTVLEHTLSRIAAHPRVAGTVVVLAPGDPHWPALPWNPPDNLWPAEGGGERAQSVFNGLAVLAERAQPDDWVLVHDAARPCLCAEDIDRLIDALRDQPVGGLLGVPVRDTMKRADAAGCVTATVDRTGLWHALTPQLFRYGPLCTALGAALEAGTAVTDEAAAMEQAGYHPRLVPGRSDNIKITRPEDLPLAEFFLQRQQTGS